MRCEAVQKMIMAYIDGKLPEGRADAFKAHLDVCPICREAYAGEVEMVAAFSRDDPVLAGDEFVAGVMARLDREFEDQAAAEPRLSLLKTPTIAILAAAAVLVTAAGLWLFNVNDPGGIDAVGPYLDQAAEMAAGAGTMVESIFAGVYASGTDLYENTQSKVVEVTAGYALLIGLVTAAGIVACLGLVCKYRKKIVAELVNV